MHSGFPSPRVLPVSCVFPSFNPTFPRGSRQRWVCNCPSLISATMYYGSTSYIWRENLPTECRASICSLSFCKPLSRFLPVLAWKPNQDIQRTRNTAPLMSVVRNRLDTVHRDAVAFTSARPFLAAVRVDKASRRRYARNVLASLARPLYA